jgi:hypothetical protein
VIILKPAYHRGVNPARKAAEGVDECDTALRPSAGFSMKVENPNMLIFE